MQQMLPYQKSKHPNKHFKDAWYYSPEVKKIKNRLNRVRKLYRRNPTQPLRELLSEVVRDTNIQLKEIRTSKWLEWCARLNQHTSTKELWLWLNRIAKNKNKSHTHPNPQDEAEKLAVAFASRSATNQLPIQTQNTQQTLSQERWERINAACAQAAVTDTPFTTMELHNTFTSKKDTAPGADGITYTMLKNMGEAGDHLFLLLQNQSYYKTHSHA